jgi:hypothetical protein
MSDNSAIAAVTATLKYLLDNGLADASRNKSGISKVTTLAPGLLKGDAEIGLNLFLYHVAENPNLRNMKLPDRHRPGLVVTSPLALDLFYILTAYGNKDFESELLLGCAVQIMHENQVLTRETIRSALHTSSSPTEPLWFSSSNLAEQVERIRVVPQAMGTEEMFWLWSAFQAGYRLSMAYQASMVLIGGAQPAAASTP